MGTVLKFSSQIRKCTGLLLPICSKSCCGLQGREGRENLCQYTVGLKASTDKDCAVSAHRRSKLSILHKDFKVAVPGRSKLSV